MRFHDANKPSRATGARRWGPLGRVVAAAVLGLVLLTSALPGEAGLKEDLEELREQQAQVQADKQAKASDVDAATADVGDVTAALQALTGEVNEQANKVSAAEQALAAAEARHAEASQAVEQQAAAIVDLEQRLESRAISSFVTQNNTPTPLLEEADPNQALRMQTLVESVTEDGISVSDELKVAKEDLEIEKGAAAGAAEEAAAIRTQLSEDLAELERRRTDQQALVDQAEARLEAQLAEAWALSETDKALSAEIVEKNKALAEAQAAAQRQAAAAAPAPSGSGTAPTFPSAGEIVNIRGIWIHQSIADNLDRMLAQAEAEGYSFSGGGYRDSQSQIRLRRAHCGTSNYAIYHMPSSQCSPPTARPGASNHERGLAIDFRYNGGSITSRSNAGFLWLKANAASYGLYNLPSEPWHWSVNGN